MYARLWWKDARQFWPIWVVLGLAAAATQWLLLTVEGEGARTGMLGFSALLWASLYALAAGAAAFAGEREAGTLPLLDVLPADRRVVWAAKVSFALVTTLALTVVLLVMAAWSTKRWTPEVPLSVRESICFVMVVPVALGWGLLLSSMLSNALAAALAALCFTGLWLMFTLSVKDLDEGFRRGLGFPYFFGLAQMAMVVATVAASVAVFTRRARFGRVQLAFRSPIVATRDQPASGVRLQVRSPIATALERLPEPRPFASRPEAMVGESSTRGSWFIEARTLARQTVKEGRKTWFLLAAVVLVIPGLIGLHEGYLDPFWLILISAVTVLVMGASVLGLENRARTHRFLAHHGARPGQVWLVKLSVWAVGVALIGALVGCWAHIAARRAAVDSLAVVLTFPLFFTVALICGMVFRRGITAVVIGTVLALGLMVPLQILTLMNLVPALGLLVVTVALLVVSWAWSGDWMLDRPAPGRWLRLGLLLSAACGLLFSCNAGFRAWSVRDIGPIAPPASWTDAGPGPVPAERNAAALYRESARRRHANADSQSFLSDNAEALDWLRRAAARPECQFELFAKQTLIDRWNGPDLYTFARLLHWEAHDRLDHGDLAGSWDDIALLFRMARHFSEGAGLSQTLGVLNFVEKDALDLAMEWASARGQTPDRLHAALAAYRDLPKVPSAADVMRAEANIVENTLNVPAPALREWLAESGSGSDAARSARRAQALASSYVVVTPWELARARRVNRLIAAAAIRTVSREPGQRPGPIASRLNDRDVQDALNTTPELMTSLLQPVEVESFIDADDRNEVARRALVQILALRAWQLRHGGQFPDHLDALVPEELASLPEDPYSGGPFGYVRSRATPWQTIPKPPPPGTWLLYSVGPDRNDDGGMALTMSTNLTADIVFEIPPMGGAPGAGKAKGQDRARDQPVPAAPK
jgi:hypothetical protein